MIAIVTTLWFWIIFIDIVIVIALVESERGDIAGGSLLVTAALLYWAIDIDFAAYFVAHKFQILLAVALYFPIGFVWSIGKWTGFIFRSRRDYRDRKSMFLSQFNNDKLGSTTVRTPINMNSIESGVLPIDVFNKWEGSFSLKNRTPPVVSDYKKDIIRWITFWPFSMLWALVNDLVTGITKSIYNFTSGIFQYISDKLYSDVE